MTELPTMSERLARSSPEAQGVSSAAVLAMVEHLEVGGHELHSLMLLRHGRVVAEGWWAPYTADRPHMLFSLSKSFASTAIGLAVEEGIIALDKTVVSLLPDDVPDTVSANLAAMRVRHLLTMSSGHASESLDGVDRREQNWARAILAKPVEHVPGTVFVYNSGATYLLSAIVQRATGQRLLDYLTPRLFQPLGIEGATWETCPRRIDVGGWGLSITTEDIARFGELYLRRGRWNDRQLVPADWVDEATSSQISNGDPALEDDSTQGYGYQFWRSRNHAYRADGAFGQRCIVIPERDAVLVLTSAMTDTAAASRTMWPLLGSALSSDRPLPEDPSSHRALTDRMSALELPRPSGSSESPTAQRVSGVRYAMVPEHPALREVQLDFAAAHTVLTIVNGSGDHAVVIGRSGWIEGVAPDEEQQVHPVAACGAWSDADTFTARLQFIDGPFALSLRFLFGDDTIAVEIKRNVSFEDAAPARIEGTAIRRREGDRARRSRRHAEG